MTERVFSIVRWLLVFVLAFLAAPALAQAPEQSVFGPKTYNHPNILPSFDPDGRQAPVAISRQWRRPAR